MEIWVAANCTLHWSDFRNKGNIPEGLLVPWANTYSWSTLLVPWVTKHLKTLLCSTYSWWQCYQNRNQKCISNEEIMCKTYFEGPTMILFGFWRRKNTLCGKQVCIFGPCWCRFPSIFKLSFIFSNYLNGIYSALLHLGDEMWWMKCQVQ